nr:Coenzyme F420 hydrogenase/dehydrogenase, beta subunit C-terminal domain [Variovorax boronicumulans]
MNEIDNVINSGMCIGCGSCAFARPDQYEIKMTAAGHWKANRRQAEKADDISTLCPMSGASQTESEIAARLYPELPENEKIGRHLRTFAAHVDEGQFRADGGSGGLVSWILSELFRRGDIDAVMHVKPVAPEQNDGLLFKYSVSESAEEMRAAAKSRYYPIEMSSILSQVRDSQKRYAIVGLPCFLKAVRLMQEEGLLSIEKTPYCLGLVCGHLKSSYFAEYLARQKGAAQDSVVTFDFRRKLMDRRASDYGFAYRAKSGDDITPEEVWPMATVRGKDWGEGLFKNAACEYCDDVLAECADVAIGDAWLPAYSVDPLGTNIVVTRNSYIDKIIDEGVQRGALKIGNADVNAVIQSQASGLRHRREGLAHRLQRRRASGQWSPLKRVPPKLAPTRHRRTIYDARLEIAERSAELYAEARAEQQPLSTFEEKMEPIVSRYRNASYRESKKGIRGFAQRVVRRLRTVFSRR